MNGKIFFSFALMCLLSINTSFAALTITEVNNAADLANEILGPGTSNVSGISYTGATNDGTSEFGTTGNFSQASIFSNGLASGLDFDSGIFISTGHVLDDGNSTLSTDFGRDGDSDLEALLPNIVATRDAAVLEFTFDWGGGDLVFNYIFASTEYGFAGDGNFNDVFGFFINPVGNIALDDPEPFISVNNTVDDLDMGANDILFDGFTNMLTATATALAQGTYSAKIAIADVGVMSQDGILDSGVFIQSNSFSIPVPVPAALPLFLSAMLGLGLISRRNS